MLKISQDFLIYIELRKFAANQNLSLSQLTELLYRRMTIAKFKSLEDLPIAYWVHEISAGDSEYLTKPRSRASLKEEFFLAKKK